MLVLIPAHFARIQRDRADQFVIRNERYRRHRPILALQLGLLKFKIKGRIKTVGRQTLLQNNTRRALTDLYGLAAEDRFVLPFYIHRVGCIVGFAEEINDRRIERDELADLLCKERKYFAKVYLRAEIPGQRVEGEYFSVRA